MAGVLEALAQRAEAFGVALCSDPRIAADHLEALQEVDRLAQALRGLAEVLSARNAAAAVHALGFGDLKTALEPVARLLPLTSGSPSPYPSPSPSLSPVSP